MISKLRHIQLLDYNITFLVLVFEYLIFLIFGLENLAQKYPPLPGKNTVIV